MRYQLHGLFNGWRFVRFVALACIVATAVLSACSSGQAKDDVALTDVSLPAARPKLIPSSDAEAVAAVALDSSPALTPQMPEPAAPAARGGTAPGRSSAAIPSPAQAAPREAPVRVSGGASGSSTASDASPLPAMAPITPPKLTIVRGTVLRAVTQRRICQNESRVDEEVTLVMAEAVDGGDEELVAAGASLQMRITQSDSGGFVMIPASLETRTGRTAVSGTVSEITWERVVAPAKKRGLFGAIVGTAIGAAGAAASGASARATVAAGAAGAAAGTAMAVVTRGTQRCIAQGTSITITTAAAVPLPAR